MTKEARALVDKKYRESENGRKVRSAYWSRTDIRSRKYWLTPSAKASSKKYRESENGRKVRSAYWSRTDIKETIRSRKYWLTPSAKASSRKYWQSQKAKLAAIRCRLKLKEQSNGTDIRSNIPTSV